MSKIIRIASNTKQLAFVDIKGYIANGLNGHTQRGPKAGASPIFT